MPDGNSRLLNESSIKNGMFLLLHLSHVILNRRQGADGESETKTSSGSGSNQGDLINDFDGSLERNNLNHSFGSNSMLQPNSDHSRRSSASSMAVSGSTSTRKRKRRTENDETTVESTYSLRRRRINPSADDFPIESHETRAARQDPIATVPNVEVEYPLDVPSFPVVPKEEDLEQYPGTDSLAPVVPKKRGRRYGAYRFRAETPVESAVGTPAPGTPLNGNDMGTGGNTDQEPTTKLVRRLPGRRRAPNANPSIEADLRRHLNLKMTYRSVVKALKPVLAELSRRSLDELETEDDAYQNCDEYHEVMSELDRYMKRRLDQVDNTYIEGMRLNDRQFENGKEYHQIQFEAKVESLREDHISRIVAQLLELKRQSEQVEDADFTDDEGTSISPFRAGASHMKDRPYLDPKYDSRSRFYLELDRAAQYHERRLRALAILDSQMDKIRADLDEDMMAMDTGLGQIDLSQRDTAIMQYNVSTLADAAEEVEAELQAIKIAREARPEFAEGFDALLLAHDIHEKASMPLLQPVSPTTTFKPPFMDASPVTKFRPRHVDSSPIQFQQPVQSSPIAPFKKQPTESPQRIAPPMMSSFQIVPNNPSFVRIKPRDPNNPEAPPQPATITQANDQSSDVIIVNPPNGYVAPQPVPAEKPKGPRPIHELYETLGITPPESITRRWLEGIMDRKATAPEPAPASTHAPVAIPAPHGQENTRSSVDIQQSEAERAQDVAALPGIKAFKNPFGPSQSQPSQPAQLPPIQQLQQPPKPAPSYNSPSPNLMRSPELQVKDRSSYDRYGPPPAMFAHRSGSDASEAMRRRRSQSERSRSSTLASGPPPFPSTGPGGPPQYGPHDGSHPRDIHHRDPGLELQRLPPTTTEEIPRPHSTIIPLPPMPSMPPHEYDRRTTISGPVSPRHAYPNPPSQYPQHHPPQYRQPPERMPASNYSYSAPTTGAPPPPPPPQPDPRYQSYPPRPPSGPPVPQWQSYGPPPPSVSNDAPAFHNHRIPQSSPGGYGNRQTQQFNGPRIAPAPRHPSGSWHGPPGPQNQSPNFQQQQSPPPPPPPVLNVRQQIQLAHMVPLEESRPEPPPPPSAKQQMLTYLARREPHLLGTEPPPPRPSDPSEPPVYPYTGPPREEYHPPSGHYRNPPVTRETHHPSPNYAYAPSREPMPPAPREDVRHPANLHINSLPNPPVLHERSGHTTHPSMPQYATKEESRDLASVWPMPPTPAEEARLKAARLEAARLEVARLEAETAALHASLAESPEDAPHPLCPPSPPRASPRLEDARLSSHTPMSSQWPVSRQSQQREKSQSVSTPPPQQLHVSNPLQETRRPSESLPRSLQSVSSHSSPRESAQFSSPPLPFSEPPMRLLEDDQNRSSSAGLYHKHYKPRHRDSFSQPSQGATLFVSPEGEIQTKKRRKKERRGTNVKYVRRRQDYPGGDSPSNSVTPNGSVNGSSSGQAESQKAGNVDSAPIFRDLGLKMDPELPASSQQ